jgi:cysteine desulfurase
MQPVYLDYNATTPVDARVLERMLPYFTEQFGNASSKAHAYGWAAGEAVEQAREEVAALVQAEASEVVFTAGATESLTTAIWGLAEARASRRKQVVTCATEHKAVLDACRTLARRGFRVSVLPVDEAGRLDLSMLREAVTEETSLVAIMAANNEIGTWHPVEEIAEVARAKGAAFVCDATQAAGKVPLDFACADALAISGHKLYGPKGVGALLVRRSLRFAPLLPGGGQEGGRRGGTLNVPGIVGLGAACALAQEALPEEAERLATLRDALESSLKQHLGEAIHLNAAEAPRLPNTTSVTIPGVRADRLMRRLRALALSAGSACSSGSGRPSHVLKALGLSDADARSTLRLSLGRFTTPEETTLAAEELTQAVRESTTVIA